MIRTRLACSVSFVRWPLCAARRERRPSCVGPDWLRLSEEHAAGRRYGHSSDVPFRVHPFRESH